MPVRRSGIGYADFSGGDANFIIGCTPASPGCTNCYARDLVQNRQGRDFSEIRLYPEKMYRLARAKFEENGVLFRRGPGSRPIVFPVDLGDIMHRDVPSSFIADALNVMRGRDDVDWLILTKRAGRLLEFYPDGWPGNVWPGVTVESQDYVWRIDKLLQVKAGVHWLSLEPMLGPLNLRRWLPLVPTSEWHLSHSDAMIWLENRGYVNWVTVGGESGNKRRVFCHDWARQVRDDCQIADIAFFYKQGWHRYPGRDDTLDGRTWKEFPR